MKEILIKIREQLIKQKNFGESHFYALCHCSLRTNTTKEHVEFRIYLQENTNPKSRFDEYGNILKGGVFYWDPINFNARLNWLNKHIKKLES